ncbi:alpha/beta hydrolase [Nocardia sp. NPDC088792]|uniref:alpha/beta hydrolase n=1 Tax=Nocardia sp. NPDC088792 TaxID=3364332 RepID=UPI00380F3399
MIWKPPAAGALGWLVGMQWPDGNEDRMWDLADDWKSSATDLRSINDDIDAAIAAVRQAYPIGDGGDQIIAQLQDMRSGNQSIDKLAEWFESTAASANKTGTELEYTKLMFYTTLVTLAADIACAWLFPPTAPAAEGALIGVAKIAVRLITRKAVQELGEEGVKLTALALVKYSLRTALIGGLMGGLQDGAIQEYQHEFGRRDDVDLRQLGLSALGGFVGGLVAAPIGKLTEPWAKGIENRLGRGLTNMGIGAIAGGTAGLGGWAVSGGFTHDWHFDPRVITAGMAGGTLPGLAHEIPSPLKGGAPHVSTGDGKPGVTVDTEKPSTVDPAKVSVPDRLTGTTEQLAQPQDSAPTGNIGGQHPASIDHQPQVDPNSQVQAHDPQSVSDGPARVDPGQGPVAGMPQAQSPAHIAPTDVRAPDNAAPQNANPGHTAPETRVTDQRSVPAAPRADAPAVPRGGAPGAGVPPAESRAGAAVPRDAGSPATPLEAKATGAEVTSRANVQADTGKTDRTHDGPLSRVGGRPEDPVGGRDPKSEGPSDHSADRDSQNSARDRNAPGGDDQSRTRDDQADVRDGRTRARDDDASSHDKDHDAPSDGKDHDASSHDKDHDASGRDKDHEAPSRDKDSSADGPHSHDGHPADPSPVHSTDSLPEHRVLPKDSPITDAEHAHARDALDRLGHDATPEHLRHDPDTEVSGAHNRATENHEWWHDLTPEQQDAMVRVHPREIGNADGIPASVRDEANRLAITRDMANLREQNPRIGKWTTRFTDPENFRQWKNLDSTVRALDEGENLAGRFADDFKCDKPPVQVLSYDSREFNGEGRAVVAFGDTDRASTVSWHIPGITTTVRSLEGNLANAFNHMWETSTRADDPSQVASIAWIGYDAPSGFPKIVREMTDARLAQRGGQLLARDVSAFNQTRRLAASRPGGVPAPDTHLFGHSYGSTTTSFAGAGGRLSGDVSTITLLGSPGAGPVGHAADFGIGAHNVFVGSSPRDPVTWIGANTHGELGRIAPKMGMGLGMDPAIEAFGARRIAAQFPGGARTLSDISTHTGYYRYLDGDGRTVPTESLHNFARIAAGESPHVLPEYNRPGHDDPNAWQRNVGSLPNDPARLRPPELEIRDGEHPYGYQDLIAEHQPAEEHQPTHEPAPEQRPQTNDCGPQALRQVHDLTGNEHVRVPEDPSITDRGMTARELEDAAGARMERLETYGGLADRLHRLGDGATALVVDEYHGPADTNGIGAHAYTVTNDGGRLVLHDPTLGEGPHPFPMDRTNVRSTHAIVYDEHGNPQRPIESGAPERPAASRPEVRIGQPDSHPAPAREQHPVPEHDPVSHERPRHAEPDGGSPGHDPIHRFDTDNAGRRYGEDTLGPIRDALPTDQLRELQQYSKKSWLNEFLRAPDPMGLIAKLQDDHALHQQLLRLTNGSPVPPRVDVLDRLVAEHPDPRDPYLDPPLRAAIDNVLSELNPHGRIDELWRNSDKLTMMREFFGTDPTMDMLRDRVNNLDQAANHPVPEGIEVCRGISLNSLDRFIDHEGLPLNGRNPRELIGTIQRERGYMSTSLSPTPTQEFKLRVRMELDVPPGTKGIWVGDRGLSGPENELLLQRESRFLITDVVEKPGGPRYDDGYVEYLIKGTLVPADYVHEPAGHVPAEHDSPARPESEIEHNAPEADASHHAGQPGKHDVPFNLNSEPHAPSHPDDRQSAPTVEPPNDRPEVMTPHLESRFDEMRTRAADTMRAISDPARLSEVPSLREDFANLLDRLGMMDPTTAQTPWRLLADHDPAFARFLVDNHNTLLPRPDEPHLTPSASHPGDDPTIHDTPTQDTAAHSNEPRPNESHPHDPESHPDPTHPLDDHPTHTPDPLLDLAERTPAGVSIHDDPEMRTLAHLVPEDPHYFTLDAHVTEDGHFLIDGRKYTPEELAARLPALGHDGRPIRLIGCDAATNDAAARLSRATNRNILAPTKSAWTDDHGRIFSSTPEPTPEGTRRPRIPPDGDWDLVHPDGTKTKATKDGFAPGTREEDKRGVTPDVARARGEEPTRKDDSHHGEPRVAEHRDVANSGYDGPLPSSDTHDQRPPVDGTRPSMLERLDLADTDRITLTLDGRIETIDGLSVKAWTEQRALQRGWEIREQISDPGNVGKNKISKSSIGGVSAVGVDRITGQVWEAVNGSTRNSVIPEREVHPVLNQRQAWLDREGPYPAYPHQNDPNRFIGPDGKVQPLTNEDGSVLTQQYPQDDEPLRHAEVKVLNQMMRDHPEVDFSGDTATIKQMISDRFTAESVRPVDKRPVMAVPFCANCNIMMDGVQNMAHRNTHAVGHPDNQEIE